MGVLLSFLRCKPVSKGRDFYCSVHCYLPNTQNNVWNSRHLVINCLNEWICQMRSVDEVRCSFKIQIFNLPWKNNCKLSFPACFLFPQKAILPPLAARVGLDCLLKGKGVQKTTAGLAAEWAQAIGLVLFCYNENFQGKFALLFWMVGMSNWVLLGSSMQ